MRIRHIMGMGIALLLLVFQQEAIADTEEDGRFWFNMNAVGKLPAEHWNWYAELQPRWRQEGSHLDQVLIRPAVFYTLNDKTSIWLGYLHVTTHPASKPTSEENRVWQQLLHNFDPVGSLTIQSRTRLEQRFIEDADDTGHKLRQMIRLTLPSSLSPKLHWVAYDEYFINLNDTDYGARRGFDQNRAFIGVNWAFDPSRRLEVGYLNQYVKGNQTDVSNHVLSTTLNLTF